MQWGVRETKEKGVLRRHISFINCGGGEKEKIEGGGTMEYKGRRRQGQISYCTRHLEGNQPE